MGFIKAAITGFSISFIASCCVINIGNLRLIPQYSGVDFRARPAVNEWLSMAKERGLKFDQEVTIGFKNIDDSDVVGECRYSSHFREIDIDNEFWINSRPTEKKILIWHELVHCYCDRGHDYGKDREYEKQIDPNPLNKSDMLKGRFSDYCPLSIMYPRVIDTGCVLAHYSDYVREMFDRCQEY